MHFVQVVLDVDALQPLQVLRRLLLAVVEQRRVVRHAMHDRDSSKLIVLGALDSVAMR